MLQFIDQEDLDPASANSSREKSNAGSISMSAPGVKACRTADRTQNVSGSVKRIQRPPLTTARNDELAPWCLSGPKLTSGPLKMSR